MARKRRIAVIGGGSAGLTAARTAHRHGADVVLCMGDDPDHASLCVNEGCMPSKSLFHPIDQLARAVAAGIAAPAADAQVLLERAVARKDRLVGRWRGYRQAAIREEAAREGFEVVRAVGRFEAPGRIGAGRIFDVDAVIIATGSAPLFPPIEGMDALREQVWTNVDILHNTELPDSLAVLGAGATGLEFALRYRRLGVEVTLIEMRRILEPYDPAFGETLTRAYEREGVRVLAERKVTRIARDAEGLFTLWVEGEKECEPVVARQVLVAAGREPALEGLNLGAAGIELDGRRLRVGDDQRVEGQDTVFAAGDAAGRRMVVHKAHIEAQIAARNAVTGGDERYDRRADLDVVYSDPEFATTGMDEREIVASGREVVSALEESRLVGKLYLGGDRHGLGKMTADAATGEILGVQLLCDGASDLIHLPSFAIEHRMRVGELAGAEFYHPTRMEIVSGLADQLCLRLGELPRARGQE